MPVILLRTMNAHFSSHIKRVVQLSLPMAGSRFLQMFSGFIATMMVGHLGRLVLASCALIGATLYVFLLVFIAMVFSLSFIVAQSFGANKYDEIGGLVQEGMLLSFLLGLIMMVFCWFAADFLRLFNESPAMLVYVRMYFHALMWGAVAIMLQSCLEQFCYGILKQRLVILINFLSMLIGIPIAYVLIFGKFGFPALGVEGLGLTFVIQAWFDFALLLLCCYRMPDFKKFHLFQLRSYRGLHHLRKIFRIGWPMSLQFGGELGSFFVVTMFIGWLGTNALAAVQVTQQWLYLIVVPIFAMSEAAAILVGQAVGAGQFSELKSIGHASLLLSLSLVFLMSIGFVCFPDFFASFYINIHHAKNLGILDLIRVLFAITAITLLLSTVRDVVSGLLRGLYDTRFPMIVGLLVMWGLVLPIGSLFAFTFHLGVVGFRLGSCLAMLIGAVVIVWRWRVKCFEKLTEAHPAG